MRLPTLERRRRPGSRRVWIVGLVGLFLFLLISLRGIAGFYTDYLWFKEVGHTEVWRGLLAAKLGPALVFTAVFFFLILVNLSIADALAPRFRPAGPEEELVERYRQVVGPYAGRVRVIVAAFLAFIAGGGLTSRWEAWLLFRNRVGFGVADAQFGTDVGFYVFTLPFLKFLFEWAFAALVVVLLVTAVAHYLNGGIRVQGPNQRVTPQVKAHLSVILGAMAFLKAFGYWLQRYELTFSTRGAVQGAGYTDVKAELPALNMLIVISIAAAILFLVNIRLRGWVLPVIAVGLWSFVSVALGGIYPAAIQRFQVEPNEFQKEQAYIGRNIAATRAAFGLDQVKMRSFDYKEDLSAADIQANQGTLGDARLWDPEVLKQTYRELQQVRQLYQFGDVDIDRYRLGDEVRQVVLAARELNQDKLPSQKWQNQHLVYTHGYGLVASPSNAVTKDGRPDFVVKNIPPESTALDIKQPALYYGEMLSGYAFVNTKVEEFDFPAEPRDASIRYAGDGGVRVDNFVRRLAFALRFGDLKVLISDQITPSSRAMYVRDIRERVEKAAPFLRYDADPYPVLLDGRVLWVIDAYTASDRFPYSESYTSEAGRLDAASGLRGRFNYVRNSVKATVDAYDGTVRFYLFDDEKNPDPIVRAYGKAFPNLFQPRTEMPKGLVDHLRYPEDLFRVQTDQFTDYHVTQPETFFSGTRRFAVAQDPGSGVLQFSNPNATTQTLPTPVPGRAALVVEPGQRTRMEPYYLLMRLPGQSKESFLILQPFVPTARGGDEPTNLVSFMVAKSDPGEYGTLEAYAMPVGQVVLGPDQVNTIIATTPEISRDLTLLNTSGSQIRQGSMLLIPTEESILYIRPLYIQGTGVTKLPEFKFVAVVYAGKAVLSTSLNGALATLFPGLPAEPDSTPTTPTTPTAPGGPAPPAPDVAALLAQADEAYNEAKAALTAGDLAAYQQAVDRIAELVRQARSAAGAGPSPTATTTTTVPSNQ